MAKLILKFNNEVIDHIDLEQGDMKIGRKATNEIFIDNLSVSGEHANFFTIGDDSFVQDLGSTNGTFVNNKRITKHHLKNGDVITVGKHTMVYFTEEDDGGGVEENTEDFARTVIINPGTSTGGGAAAGGDPTKDTMSMKPPKKSAATDRQGAIFVLSGGNSGKRIELTKSITNLGKTGRISGSINKTGSGYKLVSSDGADDVPRLNGRPVEGSADLKNGDIIEVAGTRLQFYLK
ncbi:MAG: FHA domain-containing protein [Proteobacteria bacterium]|nr:FHA domain-containing protein [Pseudomonadota bacterium]